MSVGETELTFIRCHACRSLVPSVASRCRMCGSELESVGTTQNLEETDTNGKSKSRVRQKSVSITQGQLEELRQQFEEPEEEEIPKEAAAEPVREHAEEVHQNEGDGFGAREQASAVEDATPRKRKRRRRRKKKDRVAESFETAESVSENVPEQVEDKVAGVIEEEDLGSSEPIEEQVDKNEFVSNALEKEPMENIESEISPPKSRSQKRESKRSNAKAESVVTESGTLVGWFVSYGEDERGVSRELRTGKFFLGGERLRESDLVIEDVGLSTPHCLVRISADDGLQIQDLMSEQGTFLRRANEKTYQRIEEAVAVENGDWLRLGDYEVMICLVPGAARSV